MNNQGLKFGNKSIQLVVTKKSGIDEIITFDSKWEYEVFKTIKSIFPLEQITIHPRVLIKPPTKHYKEKFWKCDFKIGFKSHILYVEAKGFPTQDFKRQLQLLDYCNPLIIDQVRIVQGVSARIDEHFQSITLGDLRKELNALRATINHVYGIGISNN